MTRRRKFAAAPVSAQPVAALSPLHVDGIKLLREDGSTFGGVIVTAFRAWQWWLEDADKGPGTIPGDRLDEFAYWCKASGISGLRALGMYWAEPGQGIGKFDPRLYSNMWGQLRAFGEWVNAQNLILHFTCGADHQTEQLRDIDMAHFYHRAVAALDGLAAVVDYGNELDKNGLTAPTFPMPTSALVQSKGSGLGDALPPVPPWSGNAGSCFHVSRDDFPRKWFKSPLDLRNGDTTEGIAIPGVILFDETIGLGEVDEPGRTCADPWLMWQASAGAALAGVGFVNAHIRSAINGLDVPGPKADACVRAMVHALSVIPQTHAEGEYQRGNSPGEPQNPHLPFRHDDSDQNAPPPCAAKRSYCLWHGTDGLFIVIEPLPGWTAAGMLKPGFSIVESWGYTGQIETVYRVRR